MAYFSANSSDQVRLGAEEQKSNQKKVSAMGGQKPTYAGCEHRKTVENTKSFRDALSAYERLKGNINFIDSDSLILTCSHDGYKENFKKIVKRKLIISKMENFLIGQDTITPIKLNSKKILYNIRFHLMPHCQTQLTNSKKKVIIKTKDLNTWVFESNNILSIEESVYIDKDDKIKQNKQIVLSGFVSNSIIKENWSLKEVMK